MSQAKPQREMQRKATAISSHVSEIFNRASKSTNNIRSDVKLSEIGKREALDAVYPDAFREIHRARHNLKQLRSAVEKSVPKLPGLDRNDVVGAMLDMEARALVRSMKVVDVDALPTALAAAVVRAPAVLSGVNELLHKSLSEKLLETSIPGVTKDIAADRSAIDEAEGQINHMHAKLTQISGWLDRADFKDWHARVVEPVEREIAIETTQLSKSELEKRARESADQLLDRVREISPDDRRKLEKRLRDIETEEHRAELAAIKSA